ncbi:MAG: fimbrillin family protein, partial [Bacteroidales bacterium]|nr:fimbrillin family protein [Bacteroidales bacterium]
MRKCFPISCMAVIVCVMIAVIMPSCSRDDHIMKNNDYAVPLSLRNIIIVSSGTTKSSGSLNSGNLGVFRLHGKGYSSVRSNVRYAASNGRFSAASGETPVYLSKSTATLAAYYPYSPSLSTGIATLTSRLYSSSEDLCYQTGVTASSSNSAVSFALRHAYAKLVFTIKHNASYVG